MAQVFNKMKIDVNNKPNDIVTAVQGDADSRFLDVTLTDGAIPIDLTGHEVRIWAKKPQNSGEVFNDGEVTDAIKGRCQFPLTSATLEKAGYLEVQLFIYKDNREILKTQIFKIMVTESLNADSEIEGSNEYGALVVLFQNLYESYDLMTEMVDKFGNYDDDVTEAGMPASTTSFFGALNNVWNYLKIQSTATIVEVVAEILSKVTEILRIVQKKSTFYISKSTFSSKTMTLGEDKVFLDITGEGKLKNIIVRIGLNVTYTGTYAIRIYIDGIQYASASIMPTSAIGSHYYYLIPVVGYDGKIYFIVCNSLAYTSTELNKVNTGSLSSLEIPFKSSLKISVYKSAVGDDQYETNGHVNVAYELNE